MSKKSKNKLIISTKILSLVLVGLVLPVNFAFSQSYKVEFSGWMQPWGNPGGTQSSMEGSINLPYNGRYEVRTYYNANSGQGQLFEEYKVLVGGGYIGQTSDPNITANGPDYENENLGEHNFNAGNHQVRLEHAWNYSQVGSQSVHPQNVTFTLKEIFKPVLSISKSVDKSTAQEGDILTYTLSYQNTGSGSATGVGLSDDFDENYLDIYDAGGGSVSGGKISWNIGNLGAGGSGTKTFKVKIKEGLPQGTTYIYNKATIDSTQTDPSQSNTVSTRVTIINNPPVADAGPDKEVYEEESVRLEGAGSDPDGDPITYSWSCTGGSLSNKYIAQPTFTGSQVSYDRTYTCTLRVTDDGGLSDSDSMRVTVRNSILAPEVETNPATNVQTDGATLNGYLQNLGGVSSANIWFQWGRTSSYGSETTHHWKGSIGSFNYTLSNLSQNTTYHFRAVAENSEGIAYGIDRTFTTSQNNNPPVADAGPDKEVYEEESVRLDGSGYDPNGDPITYYWSCTGGYLSNRYTSRPTFDAPSVSYDRNYTCTLRVTDDKGLSDSDSMRVRVLNQEEEEEVCSKSDSSCSNPDGYMYLGDERTGCLNNGDWKYYKVRQSSGKRVEVELSWSGTGCNVNDLIVYSSSCGQIYSEENNSWTKTWEGTPSSDIVIGLDGDSSNKDCRWNLRVTGGEEGELSVKKSVKNVSRGDTEWYNIYRSANPSEELIFKIVVKSTGGTEIRDVKVRDTLPSRIIYQGDLEIDGVSNSRNITETAVNIGDLSPGESKTITFEAKVAAKENFSYGTTALINSARAYTDEISETDTCEVKVTRKKVAGVVTGVSNGILDSILLPLGIALLMVWIFRSKLIGLDKWAEGRKKVMGEYRAKKTLKKKITQLKSKGYFKE